MENIFYEMMVQALSSPYLLLACDLLVVALIGLVVFATNRRQNKKLENIGQQLKEFAEIFNESDVRLSSTASEFHGHEQTKKEENEDITQQMAFEIAEVENTEPMFQQLLVVSSRILVAIENENFTSDNTAKKIDELMEALTEDISNKEEHVQGMLIDKAIQADFPRNFILGTSQKKAQREEKGNAKHLGQFVDSAVKQGLEKFRDMDKMSRDIGWKNELKERLTATENIIKDEINNTCLALKTLLLQTTENRDQLSCESTLQCISELMGKSTSQILSSTGHLTECANYLCENQEKMSKETQMKIDGVRNIIEEGLSKIRGKPSLPNLYSKKTIDLLINKEELLENEEIDLVPNSL